MYGCHRTSTGRTTRQARLLAALGLTAAAALLVTACQVSPPAAARLSPTAGPGKPAGTTPRYLKITPDRKSVV